MDDSDDGVANLIPPRLVDLGAAWVTIGLAIGILEKTAMDESDALHHLRQARYALTRKAKEAKRAASGRKASANDIEQMPGARGD